MVFLNSKSLNIATLVLLTLTILRLKILYEAKKKMKSNKINEEDKEEIKCNKNRNDDFEKININICHEIYNYKMYKIMSSLIFILPLSMYIYRLQDYLASNKFNNEIIKKLFIFWITFLLVLTYLYRVILKYRIKRGYFGANYQEAKEILYYIKNSNDNNRHNGKKIFDETEKNVELESIADKTHLGQEI